MRTRATLKRKQEGTHMLNLLHNLHLVFHFLVEYAILDKAALVELLGGIGLAVKLGGHLVHGGKGALADLADAVVAAGAVPFARQALGGGGLKARWGPSCREAGLRWCWKQVNNAGRPRANANGVLCLCRTVALVAVCVSEHGEALEVGVQVPLVGALVLALAAGHADEKGEVVGVVLEQDRDLGTAVKGAFVRHAWAAGLEQHLVDGGSVGGLVLQHEHAVLVDEYAEVDVTETPQGVVVEADVAPVGVAAKGEALQRVFDLGGQPQDERGAGPRAGGGHAKVAGMVLIGVVDIDVLGLLAADNKRRALAGKTGCFVAGVGRVGEEEADDVGNVLVSEARVLLAYPPGVYDILGGCWRRGQYWTRWSILPG